jgi:glutamyl-tRNA synthetase
MNTPKPRVRFAPSPTGYLHIGSVRTTIFNYLFARHYGGTYLLRIEDTDLVRSRTEYTTALIRSLAWLGLSPDEEPLIQSSRMDEHMQSARDLMNTGKAYPCFCEPNDMQEKIEALDKGIGSKYPETCRYKEYSDADLLKPHAIRFKVPHTAQTISFNDMIRGKISMPMDQLDDFIIVRRDGVPTYNFAVVLDDLFMDITHVVRGEDHIPNTPKQILIYEALGKDAPDFAHIPLILGTQGNRLSKRDGSVSVEEFRDQGFLPSALFNYLVRLGWSHGDQEIFNRDELIKYFSFDSVGKKGAIFDIKKLEWLNGIYLRELTYEEFIKALKDISQYHVDRLTDVWPKEALKQLFELYKQRAKTLLEITDDLVAFSQSPDLENLEALMPWYSDKTLLLVESFLEGLDYTEFNHDALLALARDITTEAGVKLVTLAQALRFALTGGVNSPSLFELVAILGKDHTAERLQRFIQRIGQEKRIVDE